MSCGTSCGTCGSDTASTQSHHSASRSLKKLIEDTQRNWSVPLSNEEADGWDLKFNDIGLQLSKQNAQSLKPLVAVYNEYGPKVFLEVCMHLCDMNITGPMICWAFVHCESDSSVFVKKIFQRNSDMVEYVNIQADLYDCVVGPEVEVIERATTGLESNDDVNNSNNNDNNEDTSSMRQRSNKAHYPSAEEIKQWNQDAATLETKGRQPVSTSKVPVVSIVCYCIGILIALIALLRHNNFI